MLILPLSLALFAADPRIGVAPGPLSPDGDRVAVFGDAPLQAEGATLARESDRVWRVLPLRGRESVALRAGGAAVSLQVGPAEGRIQITFDPPEPVKGRDRTVTARFEIVDRAGKPIALEAPPRVVASAGTLGPVAAARAPGTFEASWSPSDSPQPEVLGLVAIAPRCPLCATPLAAGVARLPVAAAIELPGTTDPGVLTRVEIAGRTWGPVRADARGRFTLPVVVPPGARWGSATSQSSIGNERRSKLDLHLAEAPGLQCAVWPERVPADGRTEAGVLCVGWSAAGGPVDLRGLGGSSKLGAMGSPEIDGDAWRVRYRPLRGQAGEDGVRVSWAGRGGPQIELPVGLAPGAPASIEWHARGEPAPPGGWVQVIARALDEHGNPLGDATVDGRRIEGGRFRLRAALGDGAQRLKLGWSAPAGGPPASLSLSRAGDAWVAVVRDVSSRPVPGVPLRFGSGARAVSDARGEARVAATGATESVEGPAGLRAAGWAGAPVTPAAIEIEREVRVALRPPGSVDVDAVFEGGWIRWSVRSPDGSVLAGRKVAVTGDGVTLGPVEVVEGGGRCAVRGGKGSVAVVDSESGATAILEIQ